MAEEKIIAVNFRPIIKKPAGKRRRAAIDFLRKQIARHTKVQNVLISRGVSTKLIKVPSKIKVKAIIAENKAIVELI